MKKLILLLSLAVTLHAASTRPKDLGTTASSPASDDYLVIDGATNGTRKILTNNIVGNITGGSATYGSATEVPVISVDANGRITSVSNTTVTAGTGNVTNNATITSGRIVLGGGTTVIGVMDAATNGQIPIGNTTSGNTALATITAGDNISITNGASSITINATGNVTNNATLTSGRLLLGGGTSIVGVSGAATNGQVYIGNTTSGNMELATLTAGDNITITNAAGSITINSTASGTGNVSATSAFGTDNVLIRSDGTSRNVQHSGITIDDTDNIVTAGNVTANVITGNTLTVTDFTTTNLTVSGNLTSTTVTDGQIHIGDGTNDRMVLGTITAGSGITVTNGAASITVAQKGATREQFLTIDAVADSMNYGLTYVTDAVTIVGIKGVHTGSGLSSPSIVCTLKHGTDRTTGTTIEAVTVSSSTTGTADDGTLSDATVPAGSWIWVETSGKSGTTDNLELVVRYTHD